MSETAEPLEHDFFDPYPGSDLRCRACGLWHARWGGDYCDGPRDWDQPAWHLVTWDFSDAIQPGAEFVAKVRCSGFHGNQIAVVLERLPDASD